MKVLLTLECPEHSKMSLANVNLLSLSKFAASTAPHAANRRYFVFHSQAFELVASMTKNP